jgi:3-methyladenine DNA glycosylase AlkC
MNLRSLASTIRSLRLAAKSDDWEQREYAGFALRDLIELHFHEGVRLTQSWATDSSDRVRRAFCLSCMQRKKFTTNPKVRRTLKRLRPIMSDDSVYVRKCCGPFVVGYLGYTYPTVVLPWLAQQAKKSDLNIRTNVAKAFSQALGGKHPAAALRILNFLSSDTRPRLRAAVGSALRNVLRRSSESRMVLKSSFPRLQSLQERK